LEEGALIADSDPLVVANGGLPGGAGPRQKKTGTNLDNVQDPHENFAFSGLGKWQIRSAFKRKEESNNILK
jgi:hypothetical protein